LRTPPYHLRPNKAVDRLTLIDAIKIIGSQGSLRRYTYYGMGGPYLEDFRLIYELYPEMKMVCIEEKEEVHKRQRFHLPCSSGRLKLQRTDLSSFLANYEAKDEKSIFWLDYTDLEFANFDDFMELLCRVGADSIIKITLRCQPRDYQHPNRQDEFQKKFETLLPATFTTIPVTMKEFGLLLQKMLQIASQKALPSAAQATYLPLSSFFYTDSAGMFTLTGIVCLRSELARSRELFNRWRFANLDWAAPTEINVPNLSTKERLHLQRHLPRRKNAGKALRQSLGYLINEDQTQTEVELQQYADFHRYFPYFVKAVP
jgi:hypothetical protein